MLLYLFAAIGLAVTISVVMWCFCSLIFAVLENDDDNWEWWDLDEFDDIDLD